MGRFPDLRVWEPIREEVAKRYRFIAYTQRYFGTERWPDDGKNFSIQTDADDLAKFITSLNAGPVHLVTRSPRRWGGDGRGAEKSLARSRTLTLHEPALLSVLPADSPEGKAAREDREKFTSAAIAATRPVTPFGPPGYLWRACINSGRMGSTACRRRRRRCYSTTREPPRCCSEVRPRRPIMCDALRTFTRPTLVTHGEKTHAYYKLINEGVSKCVPGAQQVSFPNLVHNAPSANPAAFSSSLFEFISKRSGL